MRTIVEKALQLDPLLAEAHEALGMAQARDAQWGQAEKSLRRTLELEPSRSSTRTDFALSVLLPLGRIEEGSVANFGAGNPIGRSRCRSTRTLRLI